ncbi:class I SAM-dependent methyltransferase [Patescibacteria group bacterium]|nr:class I SAM-dependent methyltransferase [Patescibacteria group bacterium]
MKEHFSEQQEHWTKHFEGYDVFQEAYPSYVRMMEAHVDALSDCQLILDSGAGTGNLTVRLLKSGRDVIAVDSNKDALKYLYDKCSNVDVLGTLETKQLDLSKPLPFADDIFDGIVSSLVIPFVSPHKEYFSENFRVLKPGGLFSISAAVPKEGAMDALMQDIGIKATESGILPEHKDVFNRMWETSRQNEKTILQNGLIADELVAMLEEVGFTDVTVSKEQPYDGYVVWITANKP